MKELFELVKADEITNARAGLLQTDRGVIPTPAFMPVGTQGTVKAISQREIKEIGYGLILSNTYHLYLKPGTDILNNFGGLHGFMSWGGAILTDSGGYQVFSLQELRKITDDGVAFKSHIDGSSHFFSPEKVVEIQRFIGSDIMMVLDECTPYPADYIQAKKSADLSFSWAKRSRESFNASGPLYGKRQFQFSIGQGSMYPDLRKDYLNKVIDIGFDGYAIGGLSVGEPAELMYEIAGLSAEMLPKGKARYLMGVGTPQNILECIELGIDMFDCVLPTRNARNGQLFTTKGKINIKNAKFAYSDEPIDEKTGSYASVNYSLAYLRHLFKAGEILGLQIATHHNLAFYKWLVGTAREKILAGEYRQWKSEFLENYKEDTN